MTTTYAPSYPLIKAVFNTDSTDEALNRYNGYTVTVLGAVEGESAVYVHPSHGETFKALASELARTWDDNSTEGPVAAAQARTAKELAA